MNQSIILFRGPIGAGKTTAMGALREQIPGSSIVEVDVIKRMIDPTESSEWRRNVSLGTAAFLAGSLLASGRSVIAEAHAHDLSQRDLFREIAEAHGARFGSVLLRPTLEVCLERARTRDVPGISYDIDDKMVRNHYDNIQLIDGEIIFDTATHTPKEVAVEIVRICFQPGSSEYLC